MPATTSQIFDFLAGLPEFFTERIEIASPAFSMLRRGLRTMIVRLREEESGHEANEIAQRMRDNLSEWLTVPVTYDGHILEAVKVLGDPALVERRWGADVRMAYDLACRGAQAVQLEENPVRVELRRVIRDLRSRNRTFKIYSHRRARPYFTSLFLDPADLPLLDSDFLSSVREYREAGTFDTLVKMGPLRAWGWGSAPDAIVTAPRFQNLIQLVWSGMADDPGFGYDPVSSPVEVQEPSSNSRAVPSGVLGHCIARRPAVVRRLGNSDFDASGAALDEDEFKLFQQGVENRPGEKRRATLAVVGPQYGILYTPNSQILSFDPMAATTDSKIQLRVLGETLVEGMFVVMPVIGDVNLGADPTNEGKLSRIWKQRLREELQINREALCRILRNKGLNLQHLPGRVENWAEPATTVIHAPQQRKHFQILIDAIAIEAHPVGGVDWWQLAWNEIRHSRGEAIQDGMHEHEIVEEQLIEFLRTMLPRINGEATGKTSFGFPLPTESGLRGNVLFFKVVSIDDGFVVPGTELKMIHELNTIEQWRI
jgi:hypothetical protein